MAIVVQRKRSNPEYRIPNGGEILWFGVASEVPTGWVVDSYCSNVFVRGAAQNGSNNTPASDNSHSHTNPAASGAQADHTHAITAGSVTAASGSSTVFPSGSLDYAPSGHTHSWSETPSGAAGAHSHTLSGAAPAEVYPPYARLYWIKATAERGLPIGGILMLDAPIASKPNGCSLCDGSGTTPDLRDKFVYGASSDGEVGNTGGSNTHVHANAAMGAAGGHSHSYSLSLSNAPSDSGISGYAAGVSVSAGGHSHGASGNTDSTANHTHTLGNTESGSTLPPYLKLYFVMRTE